MIDKMRPSTREKLVESRCLAIVGRREEALEAIREAILSTPADDPLDILALQTLKAEVLHLDGDDNEAMEVFEKEIDPLLSAAPEGFAVAAGYNRSDVAFGILKPADFYAVVDEGRIIGVEFWDYETLWNATVAAAEGRHYEALPAIWRNLMRTYGGFCWRAHRSARRQMARESLALGLPHEAVFHAIMAADEKTAREVGAHMLALGTPITLRVAVEKLLECANLQKHFLTGCVIVEEIADAIPEEQMHGVLQWAMRRAELVPGTISQRHALERTWKLLSTLALRLNLEQACVIARAATGHTCWRVFPENREQVVPVRKDMIKAVARCVDRLPADEIALLVEHAIPLATKCKQDYDYADVVSLLCRLAHHGGEKITSVLRDALYPPGLGINALLLQVTSTFGKELTDEEGLSTFAEATARHVRLQVQRCENESEFQQIPGSLMQMTANVGAEKLRIHVASNVEIAAVLRHRRRVPEHALCDLISAILEMIVEKENLLTNEASLANMLRDVGDSCGKDTALRIRDVLLPIAAGNVTEPSHGMSAAEADNPLNPFKMHSGRPSEVRGAALYTLACIERDQPGVFGQALDEVLELALTDRDPEVRKYAFAAAREKPSLSDGAFMALLLGTRDSDTKAAETAFRAIANKKDLALPEPMSLLLVHSLRVASQSRSHVLRRAAAYASRKSPDTSSRGRVEQELRELREVFARDTCCSVRKAAEQMESEES